VTLILIGVRNIRPSVPFALLLDDPPVPYAEISATLGIPGRQHRPQRRVLPGKRRAVTQPSPL